MSKKRREYKAFYVPDATRASTQKKGGDFFRSHIRNDKMRHEVVFEPVERHP